MRPHTSHSQLNLFSNCGEAYRRRYVEGERLPPVSAMLRGTGLHKAAEANFRQKIESRQDMPYTVIEDAAVESFRSAVDSDGIELTPDERSVGMSKTMGRLTDSVREMAYCHAMDQAPQYQPTEVEVTTTIELPGRDLVCITDLRTEAGEVIDFKTSRKRPNRNAADTSLQLTVEYAAYIADTGREPTAIALDVISGETDPVRTRLDTTRTQLDLPILAARIDAMENAIQAGVFLPANPTHWMCSAAWCGFHSTCPYAMRKP